MDDRRFDELSRELAGGLSRRRVLRGVAAGLAAAVGLRARGAGAGVTKLPVCHYTGSETNPWEVISLAEPAWEMHFAHGDTPYVNCCADTDCARSSNPCTDTICRNGACVTEPVTGRTCDDGNLCTTGDTCQDGICVGTPVSCSTCTTCAGGQCVADASQDGAICDDGDACTTGDTCQAGICTGTAVVCDDALTCTTGTCNAATGQCELTPGTCLIAGTCYDASDRNPADACQFCDPVLAPGDWTPTLCGRDSVCFEGICLLACETEEGASCDPDNPCCETMGLGCIDGVCRFACVGNGGQCVSGGVFSPCCPDLGCSETGFCIPTCSQTGEGCSVNENCCTGLCSGGECHDFGVIHS